MNQTKLDKVLDRIAKLLAMANDTSSPEEAAIAARRANALMREHQIEEAAVLERDLHSGDAMGEEVNPEGTRTVRRWAGVIAFAVAQLNDCRVILRRSDRGQVITIFQGHKGDAQVASWVYSFVCDAVDRGAREYAKENLLPRLSKRAVLSAYRNGFANGVADQVQSLLKERRIAASRGQRGTDLMMVKKTLVEQRFGVQKTRSRSYRLRTGDAARASNAGERDGRTVNLSGSAISSGADRLALP